MSVLMYVVIFFATVIVGLVLRLRAFSSSAQALDSTRDQLNSAITVFSSENEKLGNSIKALSENLEKENQLVTQIQINKYLLDSKGVVALESSVGNYVDNNKQCKIYIQSSLFVLEKGPLESPILWNLRKGIKYVYMIPNKDVYISEYYRMLKDWYMSFSKFLRSKEGYLEFEAFLKKEPQYRKFWSSEYLDLYKKAGKLWQSRRPDDNARKLYCEACKILFQKLIETHVDDEGEFYITVAVYEIKRNEWEAIIKLPTQNINNEYYAFQIPSFNQTEKAQFIRSFQSRYKDSFYEKTDSSTLGGVLQLDLSRIFE